MTWPASNLQVALACFVLLALAAAGAAGAALLRNRRLQRAMLAPPAPPGPEPPGLRGSLMAVDLSTILGLLGQSRATGVLTVWTGDAYGRVVMRAGELVDVRRGALGPAAGADALGALLRIRAGSFQFEVASIPSDVPTMGSVEAVMLRATASADKAAAQRE